MVDKFNFEQFTSTGSKLGSYRISITNNASFGLNSGFYIAEKIKDYTHVKLFYDKSNKVVGFIFTNDKNAKGTIKISHAKKNSGYISGKTFFLSIFPRDPDEVKKYIGGYVPKTYEDDKMGKLFYISLDEKES